jgi:hypothetical protein
MTSDLPDSLALLSLDTALQIDRHLKGRPFDYNVFKKLGNEMSQVTEAGVSTQASFLASDPIAAEIVSEAAEEASQQTLGTIDEVVQFARNIAELLQSDISRISPDNLSSVKNFCLAFHKSILAQQLPPLKDREDSLDNELRFTR